MPPLRVGSVVLTTCQGLGVLARDFYRNGIITDVIMVEHSSRWNHPEWYPEGLHTTAKHLLSRAVLDKISQMDAMLFFETPFEWQLIHQCKRMGVRTALMTMYECMPRYWPVCPDVVLAPSLLDKRYYPEALYLPVPVEIPWRLRTRAEVFVHNSGNGGMRGRNGTSEFMEALKYVTKPIKIIVRTQAPSMEVDRKVWPVLAHAERNLRGHTNDKGQYLAVFTGTVPYEDLYREGDVFVFPEKFNGLSLPLQEAFASGMAVIATHRYPMNQWLPNDLLVEPIGQRDGRFSMRLMAYQEAIVSPSDIARKIDEVALTDISQYSLVGRGWAETMTWQEWRPKYIEALCG